MPNIKNKTKINSGFWKNYIDITLDTVIPYQYEALNDRIEGADPSYAIRNFKAAAKETENKHGGRVFQDSDLYKWIEAAANSLGIRKDSALEKQLEDAIILIEKAQQEDGYLNTYFTLKEPNKKWTNLYDCHELYCIGHLAEAAAAYYKSTGKYNLIKIAEKAIDNVIGIFGNEENKIKGYPGHQEIEIGLVKLYNITGDAKFLNLAKFFIDTRGETPNYFLEEFERNERVMFSPSAFTYPNIIYNQSHKPAREQNEAKGHAVRAVYMYTAMADLARLTKDNALIKTCENLWNNIVGKQMYITGGIGSTEIGESFTFDYDLPNDITYSETCASIGLLFFTSRMSLIENKSKYSDLIERILYNIVIASMSLDGKHYFYVNPLQSYPKASKLNPNVKHVETVRRAWFGCSCCPPNVARLLSSLTDYIYMIKENVVFIEQFITSNIETEINKSKIIIEQDSNLPWDGNIKIRISSVEQKTKFKIAIRMPYWSKKIKIEVNKSEPQSSKENGYIIIDREWEENDIIEYNLSIGVSIMHSNPLVRHNSGKVAIQRGPLLYCIEEADNFSPITSAVIDANAEWKEDEKIITNTKVTVLKAKGYKAEIDTDELYTTKDEILKEKKITAIPYYIWANRGANEMEVWIRKL